MRQAGEAGINTWIWWPASQLGLDPYTIGKTWTVTETVNAFRGLHFLSMMEWARSPKPKE